MADAGAESSGRVHIGAEFYNEGESAHTTVMSGADSCFPDATVYDAVREVPYGKVSTYGHIAKMISVRQPFSGRRL